MMILMMPLRGGGLGGNHQNDDVIYERLPGSKSIICVVDQWVDNELNE